jgi:hypothetical protein
MVSSVGAVWDRARVASIGAARPAPAMARSTRRRLLAGWDGVMVSSIGGAHGICARGEASNPRRRFATDRFSASG